MAYTKFDTDRKTTRPLRVCMLAYTFYETDGRVIRYAKTLAQEGAHVDAIVLRRHLQPTEETIDGVRVLRIQRREKNEKGKLTYLFRILLFWLRSMIEITRQHRNHPYDVIHVHSVPDFQIFAAFWPKLKGAKLILDIHDIVPEFYAAKFNISESSLVFRALKLIEKASCSYADHVIAANDLWLAKITSRSADARKCSVFLNYPDPDLFHTKLRTREADGKFIVIYPGTLNWHQGIDIAVRAFSLVSKKLPNAELRIYGEGSSRNSLEELINELGLNERVKLNHPLPIKDIALIMANADIGIVPKRNDSFGGEAFSTKILEFMALGVPVIAADTRIDTTYFDDSVLSFFEAGDYQDLASVLAQSYQDQVSSTRKATKALKYVDALSWKTKRIEYLNIVEDLAKNQDS